ncbi:epoxyqueuosine reductase QueH [Candidatus Woesearchaeota archaeon]|nr:epoxyqueuosine reductase QueH [Candidatus Woesearchaeota archaeon]
MTKLLLHVCCAPCLLGCINPLQQYDITLFFYNPNIHPSGEYLKRLFYVRKAAQRYNLPLVVGDYDFDEFFKRTKGLEQEKENGARCEKCFDLRLRNVAKIAKEKRFDLFATTLTVSPFKNLGVIRQVGRRLENDFGVEFLAKDFNKEGGFKRSLDMCKELDVYRQNYCGCIFSLDRSVASPNE